jgi:AcrR family transcriptional regulator
MNGNEKRADEAWTAIENKGGKLAPLAGEAKRQGLSIFRLAQRAGVNAKTIRQYFVSKEPGEDTVKSLVVALGLRPAGLIARALTGRLNERDEGIIQRLAPQGLQRFAYDAEHSTWNRIGDWYERFYLMHVGLISRDQFESHLEAREKDAEERGEVGPLTAMRDARRVKAERRQTFPPAVRECYEFFDADYRNTGAGKI